MFEKLSEHTFIQGHLLYLAILNEDNEDFVKVNAVDSEIDGKCFVIY